MAAFVKYEFIVFIFTCLISQIHCLSYEKTKVLNHADLTRYASCSSVLKAGYNVSGVYRLTLNNTDLLISCEFKDGNAYNVILKRVTSALSFIQPWSAYENGFGTPDSNHWAGLANIYLLTSQGNTNLQILTQDWSGTNEDAYYSGFYLEQRSTRYRLHVGTYRGTLPDDLSYHNNMPFSTYDAPDPYGCAAGMKAGWWYNFCAYTLPTGIYYNGGWYTPTGNMYDGIFWKDWHGYNYSLKFILMTLSS